MSFALNACVTEVVRQMIQLTGTAVSDNVRPVSGQYAAVLPQVTPAAVLMELRGSYGARFVPSVAKWSEVGQSGEGRGVLYKLATKPPTMSTYYFTIQDSQVRQIVGT